MAFCCRVGHDSIGSLAKKLGRIYGEPKSELQSDLEVLCDKRYKRTCEFVLFLREEPIDSRDMIAQLFLFTSLLSIVFPWHDVQNGYA
jgi:hypothetical protein